MSDEAKLEPCPTLADGELARALSELPILERDKDQPEHWQDRCLPYWLYERLLATLRARTTAPSEDDFAYHEDWAEAARAFRTPTASPQVDRELAGEELRLVALENLDLALANDPRTATPLEASIAHLVLTSMYSHRADGIPTQYVHGADAADAARTMWTALITALRTVVNEEMVEKAAKAAANDPDARLIAGKLGTVEFDDMDPETQEFWCCIARAALSTVRDTTEGEKRG